MSAVLKETESKELTIPSIKVEFTPASISFNFDEINTQLDAYLEQKISLVTEETIKEEKRVIASLRKEGTLIKSTFKEYKDKAIEPLSEAEKQISLIVAKFTSVAEEKANQVKRIEDETRKLCSDLLRAYLYASWDDKSVDNEFRKADVDDLIKLTSLTAKSELTKAAKQSVIDRVNADLAQQNKIKARIMQVENLSLRNDINPPLSRANVEAFLYADDFDIRLGALISAEVARKTEAEERLRKKLEAEKQKAIDDALAAQQAEANRIAREAAAEAQRIAEQERATADKLAAQAKAEADAIAQKAKQEAAQSTVPVKDVESLKQDISELSEANARFPEQERTDSIKRLKPELSSIQQESKPAPEGSVIYKVQVELKKVYEFTSKPGADRAKIEAYFKTKAAKEFGIDEGDILSVKVL